MYPNIVALSCNSFFSGNPRESFAFLPHFLVKVTIFLKQKLLTIKLVLIIATNFCVKHCYKFLCKTLDSKKNSARYCHTLSCFFLGCKANARV